MLTLLPFTVIEVPVPAMAGASPAAPSTAAACGQPKADGSPG